MFKALLLACLVIALLSAFVICCVVIFGAIFGDSINKDFVGVVALSFGCAILIDIFGSRISTRTDR